MPSKTVGSPGSLTLAQFQTVIQQQEGIYGPLIALGSQDRDNLITLEITPAAPHHRAELETIGVGNPPQKQGYTLVCTGNVFVENQPVIVAAYRQTS